MATKKPRNSIGDYKDRMTSPLRLVLTDPKTRKPKRTTTSTVKKGK